MDFSRNGSDRIQRSFQEISSELAYESEQASLLINLGWSDVFGWDTLLESKRVLIIAEAGTGKTFECRAEQTALWEAGEAAFYFDLSELANNKLRDLMSIEEDKRFDSWLTSQSDIATLFLDSIDELKLTLGSFETALKRINKSLAGQFGRVRIVITTRPTPVDSLLIRKLLPFPDKEEMIATDRAFADIAVNNQNQIKSPFTSNEIIPIWRNVALMPLSDVQIGEMANLQGVSDVDQLLKDIKNRNAEEFARRPQDLIELCADWQDCHRIRTHHEQVAHNIAVKLKPRTDRKEKTQLTEDKALEGASRLAIAALLTRKLTFRHNAEADKIRDQEAAVNVVAILTDWTSNERETLLERALFGFANYGRVRFHHRSVIDYLGAHRIKQLLERGMSVNAAKRLLFAETPQNIKVVKPSMRIVAAWLASSQPRIFNEVRDREPEILLDHADPESLSLNQRIDALRAYVEKYGNGKWRGLDVPNIQVHRLASNELAPEVLKLWRKGIENPEVRELLLELIGAVPMDSCAEIAYSNAVRDDAGIGERLVAVVALVNLNDSRIDSITYAIETNSDKWPIGLVKSIIVKLFPDNISVERLCRILSSIEVTNDSTSNLSWYWPQLIDEASMPLDYLDKLRQGLTRLITEKTEWSKEKHTLVTSREYLINPLAAACVRQLRDHKVTTDTLKSSAIATRFSRREGSPDQQIRELIELIGMLPTSSRETIFWADDAFLQHYRPQKDPWHRLFEVIHHGAISVTKNQDECWILPILSDTKQPISSRALMLEAAIRFDHANQSERRSYVSSLKKKVADSTDLSSRIDVFFKPTPESREFARYEKKELKRKKQVERRQAKDHASWVIFWREVADNPNTAFNPDRADNTTWNLWRAMNKSGQESRESGWNRRFIEKHFSKEIADRLRLAMLEIWRKDQPSLLSERTGTENGKILMRWQLGLAAIAAEAEDPAWASKLSIEEAELAARYTPIELNGFPSWLESLVKVHPTAVDNVLGLELVVDLNAIATANFHSSILQNLGHTSETIAKLFLPRLRSWFNKNFNRIRKKEDKDRAAERLRRVIDLLLNYDSGEIEKRICDIAAKKLEKGFNSEFSKVWFTVLMRLDPSKGTHRLEQCLSKVKPSRDGLGVELISLLFGNGFWNSSVDLSSPKFTPDLLLRLVRIAYRHVRLSDNAVHEKSYSPDTRDHAEEGRNALQSALLNSSGPDSWTAKLEIANDPLFAHFRDRALYISRNKAAEESDNIPYSYNEINSLEKNWESPPSTRDEMFALLVDRLDDLTDLLLCDESPRAAWAIIEDETTMRRVIARELSQISNGVYTVDQEGVTADEKETDIRLRSASSNQQAVIELKIGDKPRSGKKLRKTLKDQLVTKYMASHKCRSGCLLITLSKDRKWKHPDTNHLLDAEGLEIMLNEEASKIVKELGFELRIIARVLDLRPRLQTENELERSLKL